jgi:GNAT superfamily N-acetyltransferase
MSGTPSAENGRREALTFREYRPSDLQRCIEITAQAWPELKASGLDEATMEWYGWPATWKDIACVSDAPVGMLFGKIFSVAGIRGRVRTPLAHATVYLKIFFGLYGKDPGRLSSLKGGLVGDMEIAENAPETDGEISYLVVDSAHRGTGIGKELMGRFIEHARGKGAKRICVYTTDPGSDWRFYEHYGFARHSLFHDGFMSAIRKEEVKAMFYVLDI